MEEAQLLAVQPYDLHGVRWYRIAFALASQPDRAYESRISHDIIYADPQAGDQIRIRRLLGVVDQIVRAEPAAP